MKKRSNPIPLLSVAVLCFVLIGYFNYRSAPQPDPTQAAQQQQQQQQQSRPQEPAVGASHSGPTKGDILGAIDAGHKSMPNQARMPGVPLGPNGKPIPPKNPLPQKIMPSDSAVSAHWYDSKANQKVNGN